MVNLEWYRTFKAVYQTGSLTAASKALFISQPNVSQHLSALEATVGQLLFERKPRILPTDYGRLFYTQVVGPLEKLERVEENFTAAALKKQLPIIRLGVVQEYFEAVMAERVLDVEATMIVTLGHTRELLARLHKGDLDFVVATKSPEYKSMVYAPVCRERFVIAGCASLDTAAFDRCVLAADWDGAEAWLLAQPWVAYTADLAIVRSFWQKSFLQRPVIKPRCVIPDMRVALKSLTGSGALAIAADYLLGDELKVVWSGRVPMEHSLYLAYDKTRVASGLVRLVKGLAEFGA